MAYSGEARLAFLAGKAWGRQHLKAPGDWKSMKKARKRRESQYDTRQEGMWFYDGAHSVHVERFEQSQHTNAQILKSNKRK